MALTLGRAKLSVHPLAMLFPVAMLFLGGRGDAAALLIALAAHEGAHILAARLAGVRVSRIRLMPFGGAIETDNPYALSPARLLAVAAAGPLANLAMLFVTAALAHWDVITPLFALSLIRINAALMLFNLLPALPLDGGRMLYALLSKRVSRAKAAEFGIWAGRIVAGLLLAACVYGGIRHGRFNISFVMAAAFILASARDERAALSGVNARAMLAAMRPVRGPMPARVVAVGSDCDARDALKAAHPDALTIYAVYDDSRLSSFTDDRRLLRAVIEDTDTIIRDVV